MALIILLLLSKINMYGGDILKKIIKLSTAILFIFSVVIFSFIIYGVESVPDEIKAVGDNISFSHIYTVKITDKNIATAFSYETESSENKEATLNLLGTIPVKDITVYNSERKYVIPGGELIGIKLKTDGVLIVGTESFESEDGMVNPAEDAGIKIGDTLISVDGIQISTNSELADIIATSKGKSLDFKIIRDGISKNVSLIPKISKITGLYKGGLWIRDSTGGIGTLTYADTEDGIIASLGHGIYDTDTGKLIPTQSGEFMQAELNGVIKGSNGNAGELKGSIYGSAFGTININCENGIYGSLNFCNFNSEPMPVATASETKTGYAQILSTVNGTDKDYYDIEIERINTTDENKNMIIKVTDEELLSLTGGIVQGMSGSPIIQNGMIIGAVTHVFLNDPTKGYGILIENMLDSAA